MTTFLVNAFERLPGPRFIDTEDGRRWRYRVGKSTGLPPKSHETAPPRDETIVDTSLDGGPFATVEFWRQQVEQRDEFANNRHLLDLLNEPWMSAMLASPGSGKLWRSRRSKLLKEMSETYAVLKHIRRCRHTQGVEASQDSGEGVVIFDVCCGQGITGLMLSFALPNAQILLIDNNPFMQLLHLVSRPMVQFHLIHLMSPGMLDGLIRDTISTTRPKWACAVGMHLCGALSPRLISAFGESPGLNALILSPCCLKGWFGNQVQLRAQSQAQPNYVVLCDELCGLVDELPTVDESEYMFDASVLSTKNGFILGYRHAVVHDYPLPDTEPSGTRGAAAEDGLTLAEAASEGNLEQVLLLLKEGADANQPRSENGGRPLYIAAKKGHAEVVRVLLEAGAEVDHATARGGYTALYRAAQQGHVEAVWLLVQAGADPTRATTTSEAATPLSVATQNQHSEVVRVLEAAIGGT